MVWLQTIGHVIPAELETWSGLKLAPSLLEGQVLLTPIDHSYRYSAHCLVTQERVCSVDVIGRFGTFACDDTRDDWPGSAEKLSQAALAGH